MTVKEFGREVFIEKGKATKDYHNSRRVVYIINTLVGCGSDNSLRESGP